jgi:hypothetical protein
MKSPVTGLLLSLLIVFVSAVEAADRSRVVYHAQMRLLHKGYSPGPADGLMGKKTRNAIAKFQWDAGLTVTGSLDHDTQAALGLTVFGYAQFGAAKLRIFDVPPQEFTVWELLSRVQELKNVKFDGSRHLMLYEVEGFRIHTGHINRLIHDECISPYEISIGEMYVQGQSLKSSDFGDIFADALADELWKLHASRTTQAIKSARKEVVLVCTAAMF